jgi:hypothetical protein
MSIEYLLSQYTEHIRLTMAGLRVFQLSDGMEFMHLVENHLIFDLFPSLWYTVRYSLVRLGRAASIIPSQPEDPEVKQPTLYSILLLSYGVQKVMYWMYFSTYNIFKLWWAYLEEDPS